MRSSNKFRIILFSLFFLGVQSGSAREQHGNSGEHDNSQDVRRNANGTHVQENIDQPQGQQPQPPVLQAHVLTPQPQNGIENADLIIVPNDRDLMIGIKKAIKTSLIDKKILQSLKKDSDITNFIYEQLSIHFNGMNIDRDPNHTDEDLSNAYDSVMEILVSGLDGLNTRMTSEEKQNFKGLLSNKDYMATTKKIYSHDFLTKIEETLQEKWFLKIITNRKEFFEFACEFVSQKSKYLEDVINSIEKKGENDSSNNENNATIFNDKHKCINKGNDDFLGTNDTNSLTDDKISENNDFLCANDIAKNRQDNTKVLPQEAKNDQKKDIDNDYSSDDDQPVISSQINRIKSSLLDSAKLVLNDWQIDILLQSKDLDGIRKQDKLLLLYPLIVKIQEYADAVARYAPYHNTPKIFLEQGIESAIFTIFSQASTLAKKELNDALYKVAEFALKNKDLFFSKENYIDPMVDAFLGNEASFLGNEAPKPAEAQRADNHRNIPCFSEIPNPLSSATSQDQTWFMGLVKDYIDRAVETAIRSGDYEKNLPMALENEIGMGSPLIDILKRKLQPEILKEAIMFLTGTGPMDFALIAKDQKDRRERMRLRLDTAIRKKAIDLIKKGLTAGQRKCIEKEELKFFLKEIKNLIRPEAKSLIQKIMDEEIIRSVTPNRAGDVQRELIAFLPQLESECETMISRASKNGYASITKLENLFRALTCQMNGNKAVKDAKKDKHIASKKDVVDKIYKSLCDSSNDLFLQLESLVQTDALKLSQDNEDFEQATFPLVMAGFQKDPSTLSKLVFLLNTWKEESKKLDPKEQTERNKPLFIISKMIQSISTVENQLGSIEEPYKETLKNVIECAFSKMPNIPVVLDVQNTITIMNTFSPSLKFMIPIVCAKNYPELVEDTTLFKLMDNEHNKEKEFFSFLPASKKPLKSQFVEFKNALLKLYKNIK